MSILHTNFITIHKNDDAYTLCYSADMYKSTSSLLSSPITITQLMTEVYNWAMSIDSSVELYRQIPTDNSLICLTGVSPNGGILSGGIFLVCLFYLFGYTENSATMLNSNLINTLGGDFGEIINRNPNLLTIDPGDGNSLLAISNFEILYLSNPTSFLDYLYLIMNELETYYNNNQDFTAWLLIAFFIGPAYQFISNTSDQYSIWYTLSYPNSLNYDVSKIVLTYNNNSVEFETINDHLNLERGDPKYGLIGNNDEDGTFPAVDEDEYFNTNLDYLTQAKIAQIYNFFISSSSNSMIHFEMYGKGTPST